MISRLRVVASSPAALEGYLGLSGALGKGQLDARTRERIALAVAEHNGDGHAPARSPLTNYVNEVAKTEIDFPIVTAAPRAT